MKAKSYHLPVLSRWDYGLFRSPGPGLGNLLFPISRALIGAQQTGGVFVSPTVRQLKLGPILRNEPDKRIYGGEFRHRSASDLLHRAATLTLPRVCESHAGTVDVAGKVVEYKGLGRYFHDLDGHRQLISDWIRTHARQIGQIEPYDIAVHVRLGDFEASSADESGSCIRQPFEWFMTAHDEARKILGGTSHSVVVFTDATADEIAPLVEALDGRLDPGRNALTSMLNLSRARIIITSRSTFSMWGMFLGDVPAIWDRRFDRALFFEARPERDVAV